MPVEFHEEDFRLKDWNKEKLKEVFAELEFKTLGKRILGEEFSATSVKQLPRECRQICLEISLRASEVRSRKSEVRTKFQTCPKNGTEGIKALIKISTILLINMKLLKETQLLKN